MATTDSKHLAALLKKKSSFSRFFASGLFLLISAIWAPSAMASSSCELQAGLPVSANTAVNGTVAFTVNVVNNLGGCGANVNLSFAVSGDTTGGTTAPVPVTGAAIAPFNFNVVAGPTGGGTATITVTCTAGCINGLLTAVFTVNTNNAYAFTATSPTTVFTNQSKPFTLSTNLLLNGAGSGASYSTNFFTLPTGPSLATITNSAAGNASTTNQIFTASTVNFEGRVVCPTALPGCPPAPVPFTVNVEPVAMTAVSASAFTIAPGGTATAIARYGSTNSVVNPGYLTGWSITASPVGGNGNLFAGAGINALGQTQISFTATVPGVYQITAASTDTWSVDRTEAFTITVAAVTRTLAVSSGNSQTAPVSTALAAPLVVLAQDNAVNAPGITINWTTTGGVLSAASSVTNAAGLANIGLTLPATAGPVTITATRADDATVFTTFTATASLVRTLAVSSGNAQTAPTNTAALRRAMLAAIDQKEVMLAAMGEDAETWRAPMGFFAPGAPSASEAGMDAFRQRKTIGQLKKMVEQSGYAGEKLAFLHPTDQVIYHAVATVAVDAFRKIGINVDEQMLDWGTVVQRRPSKEPVDKGGWSMFPAGAPSPEWLDPLLCNPMRSNGARAWFGWPDDPKLEAAHTGWVDATTDEERRKYDVDYQLAAFDSVPLITCGTYLPKAAWRSNLKGLLKGSAPVFWNVEKT